MILSDFENSTVGYKKSTGEPGLGFDKIMKTATHARTHTNTTLQLFHFTFLVSRTSGNEVRDVSCLLKGKGKGTAIALLSWTDPELSRKLRLPYFKTFGT